MRTIGACLLLLLVIVQPQKATAACSRPIHSAASLKTIPTTGINQTLFANALLREANFARCKKGRKSLIVEPSLTKAATRHAVWMARAKKLNHKGSQGFKARMRGTGVKFKTASENIAAFDRFRFPKGQFKVKNASACKFATQSGAAIPAHSYGSLAQAVVAGWMTSSGHRKNLLNGRIKLTGSGLAFDRKAPLCGRFYITQNYTG